MADIEIKICTFCGSIIPSENTSDTVWFCPSCGQPQCGQPKNSDENTETM